MSSIVGLREGSAESLPLEALCMTTTTFEKYKACEVSLELVFYEKIILQYARSIEVALGSSSESFFQFFRCRLM